MRIFRYYIFIFLVVFTSCTSIKTYNAQIIKQHSVAELHADVDKTYSQLQKFHPALYRYISKEDLDAKFKGLKDDITMPMGSQQFWEKLVLVINEVRQGHLDAVPPKERFSKEKRKQYKGKKNEFYALDFTYLDDKLWIKENYGKDSLLVGEQVLAVDKVFVPDLITKYRTFFSSDGYNTTFHDRTLGINFAYLNRLDNVFKDSVILTLKNRDSIYSKTFGFVDKSKKESTVDTLKKEAPKVLSKSEKLALKQKRKAKKKDDKIRGYVASKKQHIRTLDFIGKDSSVAYLKIRRFSSGKQKKFYKSVFKKLDSAKAKNLIIDLRDNPGGSLAEIANLYSYLATAPFTFIKRAEMNTRFAVVKSVFSQNNKGILGSIGAVLGAPFMATFDVFGSKKVDGQIYRKFPANKEKKPKENNYKEAIYVLINGRSFSASAILSANLQGAKRAILIGEETGGSYNSTVAGIYKTVRLPHTKVRLDVGLMQLSPVYQTTPDGYGVKPAIEIIPTLEDFKNGVDPEMERAFLEIYGE